MSKRKEKVMQLFEKRYSCSQAVFLGYCDLFGIDKDTGLKIASGFGGGIAGMGETCGAINSAVMLLGLKYGFTDTDDLEGRKKVKETIKSFINDFNEKHAKIYCRSLLTEDEGKTHKIHSDKCFTLIEEVCDLLEKYLLK